MGLVIILTSRETRRRGLSSVLFVQVGLERDNKKSTPTPTSSSFKATRMQGQARSLDELNIQLFKAKTSISTEMQAKVCESNIYKLTKIELFATISRL